MKDLEGEGQTLSYINIGLALLPIHSHKKQYSLETCMWL